MNINLLGSINTSGYGYTTYNLALELNKTNNVSLFPIGERMEQSLACPEIDNMLKNAKFFDKDAPCIRCWHQYDMTYFAGHGSHIGFPIFELDKFTDQERHHLNSCDRLFVCSEWAKEICVGDGITVPIDIVNLGFKDDIFKPTPIISGPTVFVNCGKWEKRKGHDILHAAFKKAFPGDENALLLMCNSNPFLTRPEQMQWEKLYTHPKIRIIPRLPNQLEVAKLYSQCDCGIFPSRAEGWNLEAMEMLACGRHLIITNFSAHKEYADSDNSLLLDINKTEPAIDNKWFFGHGNWANLDDSHIDKMVEYMRHIHDLKQSGKLKINEAGIETSKQFTWKNMSQRILELLTYEQTSNDTRIRNHS